MTTPLYYDLCDAWKLRRFEPVKRLHDWYGHHGHRFEIKGGITFAQVMVEELYDTSPLLQALVGRADL